MNNKNYNEPPPPYKESCNAQPRSSIQRPTGGIFQTISKAFANVEGTLDGAARNLTNVIDKAAGGDLIASICRTGNIIQLSPKNFGTCIQILADSSGYLFVDPCGSLHPQAYNTHWSVYMEPGFNNIIKLYNQVNYLSISNNQILLIQANNPTTAHLSTRFRVRQTDNCLSFESLLCPRFYITYDQIHNSMAAKDVTLLSNASYFHPTLVYSINPCKR